MSDKENETNNINQSELYQTFSKYLKYSNKAKEKSIISPKEENYEFTFKKNLFNGIIENENGLEQSAHFYQEANENNKAQKQKQKQIFYQNNYKDNKNIFKALFKKNNIIIDNNCNTLRCLLLCGCGGSKGSANELDMKSASKALDEAYTNMIVMDDTQLNVVYGLDLSLLEDYIVKCSSDNNGNFYALLKVSDTNKKEVKAQMDNLFAVLETQSSMYTPEAVALIKNHLETSVGSYLIYIVGNDTKALYEKIKDFIK